jgi:heme-degrading monooxygenase HmoA
MHARITQFHIRQGKLEEFLGAIDSLVPLMHEQKGFRGLLVLRGNSAAGGSPEATVITTWDSLDSLRGSEENLYFYRAMSRVLEFSDGFPAIGEHEVLASEFSSVA